MTSPRGFRIRQATAEDAEGVLKSLQAAFEPYRDSYTPQAYRDTTLTSDTITGRLRSMSVLAAVTETGEIAGTLSFQIVNHREGHLRGMAVLPAWQGAGVGATLLAHAERELRRLQCDRVTLDVAKPLRRAVRFYEKHGYGFTGRVTDFFGMSLYEYAKFLMRQARGLYSLNQL
jgi:ribosomal protein S18 acetylase RimI-like enzyme